MLDVMDKTRDEYCSTKKSCHMVIASKQHYKAILTMIEYCDGTKNQEFFINQQETRTEKTRHLNL